MKFDKEAYWKRRNNVEVHEDPNGEKHEVAKPLRGQGDIPKPKYTPNKKVTIGFNNKGETVVQNREYRRRPIKLPKAIKISKRKKK
jgi:hypothetical protein